MRFGLVLVALYSLIVPAHAEDQKPSPTLLRVMNNFAHEHATCAAYMIIASKCFATDKNPELRDRIASVGTELVRRGREWTSNARLKPETFIARMEIEANQMSLKIENNCSNISILIAENATPCKLLTESPEKRIEALTDDIMSREAQGR